MIAEEKIRIFSNCSAKVEIQYLPYEQQFDSIRGLIGRLRSTSYVLTAD